MENEASPARERRAFVSTTSCMSLNHDFVLLDRAIDGEWELTRFIHDPRAIHLHDNFVRYMLDTLKWIPAYNPSTKTDCLGLNMWGPTLIEHDGAIVAERVFRAWAGLFANGPSMLELTGAYCWREGEPEGTGRYEQLRYSRDDIVGVLQTLADYAGQIQMACGRLYLYHGGV
jgi:hypothetical protein